MNNASDSYQALCTEFYDLDKPAPPLDALNCYLRYADEAQGSILEPMCGTGRFLIPLLEKGYDISGFDSSPHMLNVCRQKCKERNLSTTLHEATFESFRPQTAYQLIFIPSGSFCHLIASAQVSQALRFISNSLDESGKFLVEIETLKAIREPQGTWRGKWVTKADGSNIVLNVLSQFNPHTRIEIGLFRYELWKQNVISQTEVEVFHVRHYAPAELEQILTQHGLKVVGKWQAEPHSGLPADDTDAVILYECMKN